MEDIIANPQFFRTALVMTLVTLPLKGWALWRAARNSQLGWFIAMLIFNKFGLLELTFIFYFSKPKAKEQA